MRKTKDVRNVELRDEDERDEEQSAPRAVDAAHGPEGKLLEGVTVVLPGGAEADVAEADRSPGKERRETGNCREGRSEYEEEKEKEGKKDERARSQLKTVSPAETTLT
jgi:hypothetical protein